MAHVDDDLGREAVPCRAATSAVHLRYDPPPPRDVVERIVGLPAQRHAQSTG